jgi:ATP-dependent Clp protease protease subunit
VEKTDNGAIETIPVLEDEPLSDPGSSDPDDKELKELRKQRELLSLANQIASEKQKKELATLKADRERLMIENALARETLTREMAERRAEVDRLKLEVDEVTKQLALETTRRKQALELELADLRAEEERLKLANSIATQGIEARMIEVRLMEAEYKIEKAGLENEVARLQAELIKREKTEILEDQVVTERIYPSEPFMDGELIVSDRRIALNGPIYQEAADYVAERIAFFNNQDAVAPIFIVIDTSPGGSAMSGFKILRSMQGSDAPVYVVVKSYAASMAAAIAALAERSFAYPNAIILHHQASTLVWGNLTQQKEALEEAQQWWVRLAEPIAAKMGITVDEFIDEMYVQNSDGNWSEFGDEAVRLNWIDHVVTNVRETSYVKNPDRFGSSAAVTVRLEEQIDENGKPFVWLPRLAPFDHYYLYNPDSYYRLR